MNLYSTKRLGSVTSWRLQIFEGSVTNRIPTTLMTTPESQWFYVTITLLPTLADTFIQIVLEWIQKSAS